MIVGAIDPAECDHSGTKTWVVTKAADCYNGINGSQKLVCDDCGTTLDTATIYWQNAHDYTDYRIVTYPTCSEKGSMYEYCRNCGRKADYTITIPSKHDGFRNEIDYGESDYWDYSDYAYWLTDKPATCTEPGLHHAVCKTCNQTIASEAIEPLGHTSEVYEDWLDSIHDAEYYIGSKNVAYIAPTCTEGGSIRFLCDICGTPVRVFELDPEGHHNDALEAWDYLFETDPDFGTTEDLLQYVTWDNVDYTPATCTEPGLVSFKCDTCLDVIRTMTVEPFGHVSEALEDYNNGEHAPEYYMGWANVNYIAPTCTAAGSITFKCDYCLKVLKTVELAPLGHDDGVWKIDFEPTADHDGQMTRYCSICNAALESKTFALHTHTFGYKSVSIAPTCTEEGEMGTYCATCGVVYDTEVIPALGHDYGTWCKNHNGTHTRGCSRCQYYETANCEYDTVVTEPTCTEIGYTTYTCTLCGFTFKSDFRAPLGHDWGDWRDDGNGETHTRTCARCEETETAGHEFTCWKYNKDGKCFKNGTKSRACTVCGCVETDVAHHTSLICRIFYPLLHWVDEIIGKTFFIASLKWFLPFLNLKIEI